MVFGLGHLAIYYVVAVAVLGPYVGGGLQGPAVVKCTLRSAAPKAGLRP